MVLLSVLWSRMTRNGALAGMLAGALTVIVWKQFGWLGLYEIIPGFVFATLAIVVFSLLDKAPSKAMLDRFADAEREFQTPMAEAIAVK
ncbi:Sodium/proline symporter [compost metagenome]